MEDSNLCSKKEIKKMTHSHEHVVNTIAGTLLTILYTWGPDILHTFLLAFVGATASFFTSLLWKWIKNKFF